MVPLKEGKKNAAQDEPTGTLVLLSYSILICFHLQHLNLNFHSVCQLHKVLGFYCEIALFVGHLILCISWVGQSTNLISNKTIYFTKHFVFI